VRGGIRRRKIGRSRQSCGVFSTLVPDNEIAASREMRPLRLAVDEAALGHSKTGTRIIARISALRELSARLLKR